MLYRCRINISDIVIFSGCVILEKVGGVMNTCADCIYYEAINGSGRCKIKHPELSQTPLAATGVWPIVISTNKACGEFVSK